MVTEKHPTETAEYWRGLARDERWFARSARLNRTVPVESIRIHEENAAEYEARAAAIEAASKSSAPSL